MTPTTEEKLLSDVGFIRAQTEEQTRTLIQHGVTLRDIDLTLNGDEEPGLKATVARHEATFSTIRKAMWIVLTPILAAAGGGVIALLYHVFN